MVKKLILVLVALCLSGGVTYASNKTVTFTVKCDSGFLSGSQRMEIGFVTQQGGPVYSRITLIRLTPLDTGEANVGTEHYCYLGLKSFDTAYSGDILANLYVK